MSNNFGPFNLCPIFSAILDVLYAIFITAIFQDIYKNLPNSFTIGILRISPKNPVVVELPKKSAKANNFWKVLKGCSSYNRISPGTPKVQHAKSNFFKFC